MNFVIDFTLIVFNQIDYHIKFLITFLIFNLIQINHEIV